VRSLLSQNYKVAIADQVVTPTRSPYAKPIINRVITNILTPGTVIDDNLLSSKENNFLLAISIPEINSGPTYESMVGSGPGIREIKRKTPSSATDSVGVSWVDVSTGELLVTTVKIDSISDLLSSISPAEIVLPSHVKTDSPHWLESLKDSLTRITITYRPSSFWDHTNIMTHPLAALKDSSSNTTNLRAFNSLELSASFAVLSYVQSINPGRSMSGVFHIPKRLNQEEIMGMDPATIQGLEIIKSQRAGMKAASLLGVIDGTVTSSGGRLIASRLSK